MSRVETNVLGKVEDRAFPAILVAILCKIWSVRNFMLLGERLSVANAIFELNLLVGRFVGMERVFRPLCYNSNM